MPKSMLVRDIPDAHAEWIETLSHPGLSRNAVVLDVLKAAFEGGWTVSDAGPRLDTETQKTFTFIDLFAGIGGFHAGLSAIGGQCVFTSEWDKYAAETYKAWTGEQHVNTDDIRTLDYAADIPDHDILCGGFPCQPFSIAGVSKKNSLGRKHGFEDERQGNLFFAICDIVAAKRPAILILENVKNLRSHDKGNTFIVISEMIDDLGYEMRAQVIDAQGWVPQHRERIFLVCFDRDRFSEDEIDSFTFPQPPEQGPRLASILDATPPDRKYMLTDKLWAYLQAYAAKHQAAGNGFGYGLVTGKDVARTMSARYYKDGSEILIKQPRWRNPRRLTPAEGARLMGFDERYASLAGHAKGFPQVVSDTQAYKQLGNSVCPHVTEAVGRQAMSVLMAMRARTDRSGT